MCIVNTERNIPLRPLPGVRKVSIEGKEMCLFRTSRFVTNSKQDAPSVGATGGGAISDLADRDTLLFLLLVERGKEISPLRACFLLKNPESLCVFTTL